MSVQIEEITKNTIVVFLAVIRCIAKVNSCWLIYNGIKINRRQQHLFDPPEGPTPKPVPLTLDIKALAATVQLGLNLEQIDQTNEKHICRVPSCHKGYSKSELLMAHLQWHINEDSNI
uniref:C2H2-type domain-containing protein n=1 Tax=Meloidogyne incognita TaxID=6306 RepID=A0A914MLG2_MELIC